MILKKYLHFDDSNRREVVFLTIFNKCHAVFVGFLAYVIVATVGYTINQGDYFQNEYLFIIINTFLILLSVAYAKWFDMISLRNLTKKEVLLFMGIFLLCLLVNIGYHSFFTVSSGAGYQHLEAASTGISLSFIASATVFGPILEEFVFRGILQGAVFDNSWLGLVLTASLFSFLHAPYDFPSLIYYLFGGFMLGYAYKKSQNLSVPILIHICYNCLSFF